jgi:lipoyl(octanoyl) transferase
MDLAPFSWINPCGYAGLETVDMRSMGAVSAQLADVQRALAEELVRVLDEAPAAARMPDQQQDQQEISNNKLTSP